MKNIIATNSGKAAFFMGLPEKSLENVTLENAMLEADEGITVIDTRGLQLKNVKVISKKTEALIIYNSNDIVVEGFTFSDNGKKAVKVLGTTSSEIKLELADFNNVKQQISIAKSLSKELAEIRKDLEAQFLDLDAQIPDLGTQIQEWGSQITDCGPISQKCRAHSALLDHTFLLFFSSAFHWGGFAPPNPPLPVGLRPPVPPAILFFATGYLQNPVSHGGSPPYGRRDPFRILSVMGGSPPYGRRDPFRNLSPIGGRGPPPMGDENCPCKGMASHTAGF